MSDRQKTPVLLGGDSEGWLPLAGIGGLGLGEKAPRQWDWLSSVQTGLKTVLSAAEKAGTQISIAQVGERLLGGKGLCDGNIRLVDAGHVHELNAVTCECRRRLVQSDASVAKSLLQKFSTLDLRELSKVPEMAWNQCSEVFAPSFALSAAIVAAELGEFAFDDWQCGAMRDVKRIQCLAKVFCSNSHVLLSWSTLAGDNAHLPALEVVRGLVAGKQLVVLAIDTLPFRVKAGANPEITAFENFLSLLEHCEVGLVCSSAQSFFPASKSSLLDFDYRQDSRSSYRDAENKLRFTSSKASATSVFSLQECLKQGAFDRLLAVLAQGQETLDEVRKKTH